MRTAIPTVPRVADMTDPMEAEAIDKTDRNKKLGKRGELMFKRKSLPGSERHDGRF